MAQTEEGAVAPTEEMERGTLYRNGAGWLAAGGILGALGASSCCLLPLILFSLGAGGAWIGHLTALAPYQPIFVAVALVFLGSGLYHAYWRSKPIGRVGAACDRTLSGRIVRGALWMSAILIAASVVLPYVAPWLLDMG